MAAVDLRDIGWAKKELGVRFEMRDLGNLTIFIRVQVSRDPIRRMLKISQESYMSRVLENHGMGWCAAVTTPVEAEVRLLKSEEGFVSDPENRKAYKSAVGSLMYAMLGGCPDISFVVGLVSHFCTDPNSEHWAALKPIFRYLAGTRGLVVLYGSEGRCAGYSDSWWAGAEDQKSTSEYIYLLNSRAISWASRKQSVVPLSLTEAEYMALTLAVEEVLWLMTLFGEIGAPQHANVTEVYWNG